MMAFLGVSRLGFASFRRLRLGLAALQLSATLAGPGCGGRVILNSEPGADDPSTAGAAAIAAGSGNTVAGGSSVGNAGVGGSSTAGAGPVGAVAGGSSTGSAGAGGSSAGSTGGSSAGSTGGSSAGSTGGSSAGSTGGSSAGSTGGSNTGAAGAPSAVGSVSRGATVYAEQSCGACHGPNAAGDQGPNITFSTTAGIGLWTYQQFHDAVRLAKNLDGTSMCLLMSVYSPSDLSELAILDLYAYLGSVPIVDIVNKGTYCPN